MSIHSSDDESIKFSKKSINQENKDEECYNSYEELFLDSIRYNEIDNINLCLENNVNLKTIDNNKNNFLHLVAANGNNDIFLILKNKIKNTELKILANSINCSGNLPLHWSTFNLKNIDITKVLLDLTDKIELKNSSNETPIDMAIQFNNIDFIKYFSIYLEKNPNKGDKEFGKSKLIPEDLNDLKESFNKIHNK